MSAASDTLPAGALAELKIRPERPQDGAAVEALIADAFGPGRFAKSADRLREGRQPVHDLSLVAWSDDRVVGCVRLWDIHIGDTPALLLGPFAVDRTFRSKGLGAFLINAACLAAATAGRRIILLVGDAPFFSRMDFHVAEKGQVVLPGPVDARRVMWRALVPGALDGVAGPVTA